MGVIEVGVTVRAQDQGPHACVGMGVRRVLSIPTPITFKLQRA